MSKAIRTFNGLSGQEVSREDLKRLKKLAAKEGQTLLVERIASTLALSKDGSRFLCGSPQLEQLTDSDLPGIDPCPDYLLGSDLDGTKSGGLGKSVSPDDIYSYITDLMLQTIDKVGHLPWQMGWDKSKVPFGLMDARNFVSKKPYRGINYFLLNFKVVEKDGDLYLVPRSSSNPYFMTFNQIKEKGGKLKRGSGAFRVVYFTRLYSIQLKKKGAKDLQFSSYSRDKFSSWIRKNLAEVKKAYAWFDISKDIDQFVIPILKYYNVFEAADIEGIDWGKLPKQSHERPVGDRIEAAELVVDLMPKPPKIKIQGDQPHYRPSSDTIFQTPMVAFRSAQEYYSTLFHEIIHATGHKKRLARKSLMASTGKRSLLYAKEELVAELGAVYLCGETGILYRTIENSAKYIEGWSKRLTKAMQKDNRFFFRAASAAQAAADFVLDRSKEGVPAYLRVVKVKPVATNKSKTKKVQKPAKPKGRRTRTGKQLKFDGLGKPQAEIKTELKTDSGREPKRAQSSAKRHPKVRSISEKSKPAEFISIEGETGKFLQRIERKPKGSVVITLDGPQGAGKTTVLYKFLNDFARSGNRCLLAPMEEHPDSLLATEKRDRYLSKKAQAYIDDVAGFDSYQEFTDVVKHYDVIFLDSWQKLLDQVGPLDLDKDVRNAFDGKIFVIIFQQTTTGRTRGGAKIVFDGDVIIKMEKANRFQDNYAYFDKHRYTTVPIDHIRYMVMEGITVFFH